jgi:hypothetical protein
LCCGMKRPNLSAPAESSKARQFNGGAGFLADFPDGRGSRRPLVVPLGQRELAELDAHLIQRALKQRQPPNGFRNILAGLLEALDRFDLLLDAELHHAKMGARGTLIGRHSLAQDMPYAIRRSCDHKPESSLNFVGTTLLVF